MELCSTTLIPPALDGPGLKNSFLINEKLMNSTILNRVIRECANNEFYHKVMVFAEEEYSRDFILKTFMDFVEPLTFLPILFKKEGNNCFFFIKACQTILYKLITANLEIKIPNEGEKFLKLEIICNFISVEALEVITTNNLPDVLKSRYDASTKSLDLSCFCDEESLFEYYPLYLSQNMMAVVDHALNYHPKSVNLQHNRLRDMDSFHSLQNDLESLDLRNNQIQSLKDLACLKYCTKLQSLYLDGNPLCALYDNYNYVIEIKSLCCSIQFIDGERIVSPPECKTNFVCRLEAREFADQFMKLFFTQYDSDNRLTLKGLYDKNAILSVSATVVPHQYNSEDIDLNQYGLNDPFLVYGVEEIMKLFQELPKSRHYPYQFTCDVTLYEHTHAAICVSGVYWEHKQFISFVRHFLLRDRGDKFTITNEQLTVMNATNDQSDQSITVRYTSDFPYFPYEYGKTELALGKLTKMNRKFCQLFLYHCQYDLNRALQAFCQAYANDRISSDVFAADETTSYDDLSSYSDLIIQKVSEISQTVTEQTIWKVMEMERLKKSFCHEKTESSCVKKIFRMCYVQSVNKLVDKQLKTLENRKEIQNLKLIRAPTFLRNKETGKEQETTKEREEAIKENTEVSDKNKESNSGTEDKAEPKIVRICNISSKYASQNNIIAVSNSVVSSDAKLKSIDATTNTDHQETESDSSTLKSKAHDKVLQGRNDSKKRKRTNNDYKEETTTNNKMTDGKNEPYIFPAVSIASSENEVDPGNTLQPQTNKEVLLAEVNAENEEFHRQREGMNEIEKMLHTIIRELETDNQSVTVLTDASINSCVQNMLSFIEQLESSYKMNGGNRTIEQPVMIKKVIPVAMEEDLTFSILHVILHEMFEYKSCKYDHRKINLNISDEIPLCSNKIYLFDDTNLLNNIREKLHQNQSVFNSLRFETEPSPVEYDVKSNQFTLPYILRASNKFDVLYEILRKTVKGSKGAVHHQELAIIRNVAQYVLIYFSDSTNILAKKKFDTKTIMGDYSFPMGMKFVFKLTESVVHVIIHEFIENSTCINNTSEDSLKIPNLPPICHNNIYRPTYKRLLDYICCLLRQVESEQRFLDESKQQDYEIPSFLSQDTSNELTRHRVFLFIELFNDVLLEIALKNSIVTEQILIDECNLPLCAKLIAAVVHCLDSSPDKKVNHEFLNRIVGLLDKLDEQESVNQNFAWDKQYLISLSRSIIHVTLHEMFEHLPCIGYVPPLPTSLHVSKSLNENVPMEKLTCLDDIYQFENEKLRILIRQCLSRVQHHFQILKLTEQPFVSLSPICNPVEGPSPPITEPARLWIAEDNLNQKKLEDNSNHEKTEGTPSYVVPTGQIIDLTIDEPVSKDSPAPSTSAVQIQVDNKGSSSASCVGRRYHGLQTIICTPLKNIENLEKHLLGRNINKTLITHFLKFITYQTYSWPTKDSRFQAAHELFDVLAESFILAVQNLVENSTNQKDDRIDDGGVPGTESTDSPEPHPTMPVAGLETKDDKVDDDCEIVEPEIEVIDLCEPDPSEIWINNKLQGKYETLTQGFNEYDKSRILSIYTGLLHVVTHEILEKSTCDNTDHSKNQTENSNLRSVICTDNIYTFQQRLGTIRRVLYDGEHILQSGRIPLNSKENKFVLSPKMTVRFGFMPEKTLNLEVYLLKDIFIYIVGKCLIKYFDFERCPLQDLDEFAEKITFIIQQRYNSSLNKKGFTIGSLNAVLKKGESPYLFQLVAGIVEVIANDFNICKISVQHQKHKKLSVGSCYLPVNKRFRQLIRHILIKNLHIFPNWLKFKHNYDGMKKFFTKPAARDNEIYWKGNHEKLARIIHDALLPNSNNFTPKDSALINHFVEKISYFLRTIELLNPALPLTNEFYKTLGIICPPNGPPYAELITTASQTLVHVIAYHIYEKKRDLDYQLDTFYKKEKNVYEKLKSCVPLIITENRKLHSGKFNSLKSWMVESWKINVGMVLEEHLECSQQPAKPVLSKKKRKYLDNANAINPKKLKLCLPENKK